MYISKCDNLIISGIILIDSLKNYILIVVCINVVVLNIGLFVFEDSFNIDGIDISWLINVNIFDFMI